MVCRDLRDSAWTWVVGRHLGDLPGDLPTGANTPRPLGFNLGSTDTSQCSQQLGVRGSCQWEPALLVGSTCYYLEHLLLPGIAFLLRCRLRCRIPNKGKDRAHWTTRCGPDSWLVKSDYVSHVY